MTHDRPRRRLIMLARIFLDPCTRCRHCRLDNLDTRTLYDADVVVIKRPDDTLGLIG